MCGRIRYTSQSSLFIKEVVQAQSQCTDEIPNEANCTVENASPSMIIPVLIAKIDGSIVVETANWGLIPNYPGLALKDKPDFYKLFNKKIEGFQNPYFRKLLNGKRCAVVVDGFYAWKGQPGHKQPFYVYTKDQPLILAAIYEDHIPIEASQEWSPLKTFSILTGCTSEALKTVVERQPIIMNASQMHRWLLSDQDEGNVEALRAELEHNASNPMFQNNHQLHFHAVTKRMATTSYQEPDCSAPIELSVGETMRVCGLDQIKTSDTECIVIGIKRKLDSDADSICS